MIARQALGPVGAGLAIGALMALAATQVLDRLGLLDGLGDRRWAIVAGAAIALGAAAVIASVIPAARAALRVRPAHVLRHD